RRHILGPHSLVVALELGDRGGIEAEPVRHHHLHQRVPVEVYQDWLNRGCLGGLKRTGYGARLPGRACGLSGRRTQPPGVWGGRPRPAPELPPPATRGRSTRMSRRKRTTPRSPTRRPALPMLPPPRASVPSPRR